VTTLTSGQRLVGSIRSRVSFGSESPRSSVRIPNNIIVLNPSRTIYQIHEVILTKYETRRSNFSVILHMNIHDSCRNLQSSSATHYHKYCYMMHPIRSSSSLTAAGPYISNILRLESLLISVQRINNGSSFESLLIMPSSPAVLNLNHFGPDSKTINNGFKPEPQLIFLNL
jgi:hypothetical protein